MNMPLTQVSRLTIYRIDEFTVAYFLLVTLVYILRGGNDQAYSQKI